MAQGPKGFVIMIPPQGKPRKLTLDRPTWVIVWMLVILAIVGICSVVVNVWDWRHLFFGP